MNNILYLLLLGILLISCGQGSDKKRTQAFPKTTVFVDSIPADKENIWAFVLAGQSNMAGRGQVEPEDTVASPRILSIDENGRIILAKEPLHFYEPSAAGLDCGLAFARHLQGKVGDSIVILLIPAAVGGSFIHQWISDAEHRGVHLLSNFSEKVRLARQYGVVKGILWHQGEEDAIEAHIPRYREQLGILFRKFRRITADADLPVLIGELGSFSRDSAECAAINRQIHAYAREDDNVLVVPTGDLQGQADGVHFNSPSLRLLGQRYAEAFYQSYIQP